MDEDHQAEWARQEQQVELFLDFMNDIKLTIVR
jgi:hypothetical protein